MLDGLLSLAHFHAFCLLARKFAPVMLLSLTQEFKFIFPSSDFVRYQINQFLVIKKLKVTEWINFTDVYQFHKSQRH